jgi:hypothetical protein
LAIRVVPANDFIGLVPAWNAFGSEAEVGIGKQDNKRSDGEEVLHRVNLARQRLFCAAHDGNGIVRVSSNSSDLSLVGKLQRSKRVNE